MFIPAFIMKDPLRSLFMPLTLAVGFAMISSYLLSSTFVPIMSVYLLKHKKNERRGAKRAWHLSTESADGYHRDRGLVRSRCAGLSLRSIWCACGVVLALSGLQVGTELFPQIDQGEFVLRFRPPPGSSFELTREMGLKCLQEIEHEAGTDNISITMGFVGQVAPNFGIDNMVLFMRGPDDGWLRVKLKEDSGIKLDEFRERLRKVFPSGSFPGWRTGWRRGGGGRRPGAEAQAQAEKCTFGFEPGDIVSQVMSFGIEAHRGSADRHRLRPGARACRKSRRRARAKSLSPRRRLRADARLSDGRSRYRPRARGIDRHHARSTSSALS